MQIRRMNNAELMQATKTRQPNGAYVASYNLLGNYDVVVESVTNETVGDEINDIAQRYKLYSVRRELEQFVMTKMNNQCDNVSDYRIKLNSVYYKIIRVTENYVEVSK